MRAAVTIVALSVLISVSVRSSFPKAIGEKANQVAATAASAPTISDKDAHADISRLESERRSFPVWSEFRGDTTGKARRWPHDPGCPCGPGPFLTPVPLEQH